MVATGTIVRVVAEVFVNLLTIIRIVINTLSKGSRGTLPLVVASIDVFTVVLTIVIIASSRRTSATRVESIS